MPHKPSSRQAHLTMTRSSERFGTLQHWQADQACRMRAPVQPCTLHTLVVNLHPIKVEAVDQHAFPAPRCSVLRFTSLSPKCLMCNAGFTLYAQKDIGCSIL
jgi:hypothetical protein